VYTLDIIGDKCTLSFSVARK